MDQTISEIKQYSDRFVELPDDLVGVMVTHMDIDKEWSKEDITEILVDDYELPDIVFSHQQKKGNDLCQDILKICDTSYLIDVGSSLFSQLFSFRESNRKILKVTNDFVKRFKLLKESFNNERTAFEGREQLIIHCEFWALFQSYLIVMAKEEMKNELDFDYNVTEGDLQQGYVVNMTNQIEAVMDDIRLYIQRHQSRKASVRCCSHCGKTWNNADVETCGMSNQGNLNNNVTPWAMANFTFEVLKGTIKISKEGLSTRNSSSC
eukprot:TCONS_00047724-protein